MLNKEQNRLFQESSAKTQDHEFDFAELKAISNPEVFINGSFKKFKFRLHFAASKKLNAKLPIVQVFFFSSSLLEDLMSFVL